MPSAFRRATEGAAADAAPSPAMGIVVTDTNMNPILQMMTWLLLAMTFLMLCFRFLTKFFLKTNQRFGWEEVLITSAFVRSKKKKKTSSYVAFWRETNSETG